MQKLSELLTIVIPVKNEEKNLAGCLERVRDFRHVVLVDSGSTDRTREVFEAFAARTACAPYRGVVWVEKWRRAVHSH